MEYKGRWSEHNCIVLEDNCAMNMSLTGHQIITMTLDKSETESMLDRLESQPFDGYSLINDQAIVEGLFEIHSQQQDINFASWSMMRLIYGDEPIQLAQADKRLVKAVAWMFLNAAENVSLSDVANQAHLSESRLASLFKDKLGATFNRIKLSIRLMYFIEQYADSNDLTASCLDAGFHDLSHFYKTYRLAFGMAPSLIFDNENPPEVVYNPGYGMAWYGEWLGNQFCQLISDKDEVSVMELLSTFS